MVESLENLTEISDKVLVHPVQHVPGTMNHADNPTWDTTVPSDVAEDSIWQAGPAYLQLLKEHWPFSWDFADNIPEKELRRPKAIFNLAVTGVLDWDHNSQLWFLRLCVY